MGDEQTIFDVVVALGLVACFLAALWILPIVANPGFKLRDLWPFNHDNKGG